jgi:AGZA family xanthine/uracil permease-like MFS transporter
VEKYFGLKASGTTIRTEIIAGLTTFFTMAYIVFVNPSILSATGMSWNGVFVATILATAIGTLIMGLVAKVPYAVAPGMGLNAFFAFTVCLGMGFEWREAMAMVFICGLINILITVTRVRKAIVKSIPQSLQLSIGGGIGLFIAYIGIKNAGFLRFVSTSEGLTTGVDAVPELVHFNTAGSQLALIGLVVTIILMVLNIKGALLIGIIATTILGIPMGVTQIPEKLFDLSALSGFSEVSFAFFWQSGYWEPF